MARSQAESCMFCGDPCTCSVKPKIKPQRATPPAAVEPVEVKKRSVLRAVSPPVATPVKTSLKNTEQARAAADEEKALRQAVTLFCESGMVSSRSIEEHKGLLDLTPYQIRVLIWKQRRIEWFDLSRRTNSG